MPIGTDRLRAVRNNGNPVDPAYGDPRRQSRAVSQAREERSRKMGTGAIGAHALLELRYVAASFGRSATDEYASCPG